MTPEELATIIKNIDNPYILTFNGRTLHGFCNDIKALSKVHNQEVIAEHLKSLKVALSGVCYDFAPNILQAILSAARYKTIDMGDHSFPGLAQRLFYY